MNFLSAPFFLFFPLTALGFFLLPHIREGWRGRPAFLLAAGTLFYLWADPAAGLWLALDLAAAYLCALGAAGHPGKRLYPALAALWCFGILAVHKYLRDAMPVGLSFYSFALVGYVADVSRGSAEAERNPLKLASAAAFFPAILSGPVLRLRDLLPQLTDGHPFDAEGFRAGLLRFLRGAFRKLVTASLLAKFTDTVYSAPDSFGSGAWILTAVLYSFRIYADFSAYTDLALGTAQMLGFTLPENFRAPYLSCSVRGFWKKWHISLTSWFREYLYFPLGGSRKGKWRTRLNILIVFAVSGLWHGAGLTFLVWGLLNGLLQIAETLPKKPRLPAPLRLIGTFGLITLTWVFFRASSLREALFILRRMALVLRDGPGPFPRILNRREWLVLGASLAGLVGADVCTAKECSLHLERTAWPFWLLCAALIGASLLFGFYGPGFSVSDFLYFRF